MDISLRPVCSSYLLCHVTASTIFDGLSVVASIKLRRRRDGRRKRSLLDTGCQHGIGRAASNSRNAFAGAVNAIERFLAPFECWSMID
ncbi:hypothetical protein [Bradyrhizobium sp. 199]|uniref:hypothetical protein n=1 Tax=Bradyrhizobium sp. 199 TaxID=2782664 RepID=UPI001FF8C0A5|nr:hypothetical protein [Bradyrhizobium sp. 199]MCK1362296.1 hypothetical protein [Bradyrhizobium sp. 199]